MILIEVVSALEVAAAAAEVATEVAAIVAADVVGAAVAAAVTAALEVTLEVTAEATAAIVVYALKNDKVTELAAIMDVIILLAIMYKVFTFACCIP